MLSHLGEDGALALPLDTRTGARVSSALLKIQSPVSPQIDGENMTRPDDQDEPADEWDDSDLDDEEEIFFTPAPLDQV